MMPTFKRHLKSALESLFHISISSRLPHGRNDCDDIRKLQVPIETILDIGANVGQSALKFANAFPSAEIHAFEPVKSTFKLLRTATSGHPKIRCHLLAMGKEEGAATMYLTGRSVQNSLIPMDWCVGEEPVRVSTVDAFVEANDIKRIDLLKVDTEGFDLLVLQGAAKVLAEASVRFVLAEVAFDPNDKRFVLFDDVRTLLTPFGFSVFGIYDQQPDWSGAKKLSYVNACFCHEIIVRM